MSVTWLKVPSAEASEASRALQHDHSHPPSHHGLHFPQLLSDKFVQRGGREVTLVDRRLQENFPPRPPRLGGHG
jgi:hypothetical protein